MSKKETQKNIIKNKKDGITLIALVITIIVLLILAGVTVATLTGDNGLLNKAGEAKEKIEKETEKEMVLLASNNIKGQVADVRNLEKDLKLEENSLSDIGPWKYVGKYATYIISTEGDVCIFIENTKNKRSSNDFIDLDKSYNFDWNDLNEIANAISNNADITEDTDTIIIEYNNKEYKIGVGDRMEVFTTDSNGTKTFYITRILGFNHDILNNNKKAGISFEFTEKLRNTTYNTNQHGWVGTNVRQYLNQDFIQNLNNKSYIKQVKKEYIDLDWTDVNDGSTYTYEIKESEDFLWLLSASEVWGSSTRTYDLEGKRYKYYKDGNSVIKKERWGLRSPSKYVVPGSPLGSSFLTVCEGYAWPYTYGNVCPGFTI